MQNLPPIFLTHHFLFERSLAGESMKEKFIKIDAENYIKEAEVIEGGVLDHGFQKYVVRIEVIGKTDNSSMLRSTIEFEAEDESKAPSVSTSA
uniref:Bet v I/Major latex protein domain-containing protein n=1 Tax=Oryza punctata TaxID=4537 RepID=A0A0E0KUK5_ORYPU